MSWTPRGVVVVPVDFSDESIAAVGAALETVEDATHLHIVHVVPKLAANAPGVRWDTVSEDTVRQHVVAALQERLADPKFAGHHVTVEFGDAGSRIAETAESLGADLIVMPSHGRTGMSRLLIGSVAERVVRLAHCPVLILRR
jgi:nucleotide-binding universal stress UspA family protein